MPQPVSATQNSTSRSPARRADGDAAPGGRELDRVADQVLEHLEQAVLIAPDVRQIVGPDRAAGRATPTLPAAAGPRRRRAAAGAWRPARARCRAARPRSSVTSSRSLISRFIRVAARWMLSTDFWLRRSASGPLRRSAADCHHDDGQRDSSDRGRRRRAPRPGAGWPAPPPGRGVRFRWRAPRAPRAPRPNRTSLGSYRRDGVDEMRTRAPRSCRECEERQRP